MNDSTAQIHSVQFKLFSEAETKKLSVLPITCSLTLDPLGHPYDNGLADTALGPLKRNDFCKTCGLTDQECLGHFGHIQLPLPVFNPFLIKQVFQVLKMFCFSCHHLLFTPFNTEIYIAQIRALDLGLDYILEDIYHYANEISNSARGFDWKSYEGKTFLRKQLTEFVNSECKKHKESTVKDPDLATLESARIVNSKNVVEKKQQLFKDLIGLKTIKPTRTCGRCNSIKRGLNVINKCLIIQTVGARAPRSNQDEDDPDKPVTSIDMKGKSYLTPTQARDHLRKFWQNEKDVLMRLFPFLNIDYPDGKSEDDCPMDVFFWETIVVAPNRFRPLRHMNGRSFEHLQTTALNQLLIIAKSMETALETAKESNSGQTIARFHQQWQQLQLLCNRIYDSQMDHLPDNTAVGVKQILEKKEGLMRKNMMGKRVNFAARSVISPDPYINANEIGIPNVFATKLSYPQPVTNWNLKQLQEMVINGPDIHPGALSVTYEDGYTVKLKADDITQRKSIAATLHPPSLMHGHNGIKIVNRHLISGDVLLLNRQPTLHKPSIMAHKARVLPKEKTLRLHYANCKCYNADFDGDEMNAHFPQSELARAEAYNIASVNYQFLVPKDGSPLSGLIQDHVVAGVILSVRGRFFPKESYQELVYGALSFLDKPIKYLPPTILKPQTLWSGKQIISTLVLNLIPFGKPLPSFEIGAKVSAKMLTNEKSRPCTIKSGDMCESKVIFRKGELLCGIMDKNNFGASKNGLIHVCYELYGGDTPSKLLTAIARLCTNFLQTHSGFTLGIHDILMKPRPENKRRKIIRSLEDIGLNAVAETFGLKPEEVSPDVIKEKLQMAHTLRSDICRKQLDAAYKSQVDSLNNKIIEICMPKGLVKQFPENSLQMMIQTGAKGASANAIQISCLLGQIELEGRRIPLMMSGRTLPSFLPYETHPRAGGFVTGRFLSGIRPQEFFFHCMAGREGLIDTAVKTSRSGYLQRCLIKHLEGLIVNYDLTVRDSEGSVIQFLYGEDGLDITKCQALKKPFFPTIYNNRDALKPNAEELKKLKLYRNPFLKKEMRHAKKMAKARIESPISVFQLTNNLQKDELKQAWFELSEKKRATFSEMISKPSDPVISKYRPDLNFGSISEALDGIIQDYIKTDLVKSSKEEVKEFRETLNVCYMKSLCAPGEAVGLLAAQSIGEPSTQMTLNTFHFAGRGEMNVTLGVPRLRELLMTASSKISNPSMDIPFRTDIDPNVDLEEKAEKVRLQLNAVRLKDVLEYVDINESIDIKWETTKFWSRVYQIRFVFLPHSNYWLRFYTKPSKILHFMETRFLKNFVEETNKRIRLLTKSSGLFDTVSIRTVSRKSQLNGDEEEIGHQANEVDDEKKDDDGKKDKPHFDDEDEDEDLDDYDVDEGEGDTTAMRQRTRLNQEQEYEEPEQEEAEANNDDDIDEDATSQPGNDEELFIDVTKIKQELDDDFVEEPVIKEQRKSENAKNLEDRRKRVLNKAPGCIIDYSFDTEKELWCEVKLIFPMTSSKLDMRTIVEEEAEKAYVHRVGQLDRAFLVKDNQASENGEKFCKLIKTEGVSMHSFVEFENLLDLRRIYTNDMHAIARAYGIEAARAALIREIKNVFAVYGISVDGRHLSLIADHMTFTGKIKGMNRGSMDGISPLQAMTFETTTNFLKNSLLMGLQDDLQSPSSRIVIGRPTMVGSGLFETRLNAKKIEGFGSQQLSTSLRSCPRSSTSSFLSATPSSSRSFGRFSGGPSFLSPSMLAPSLFGRNINVSHTKRTREETSVKEEIDSDADDVPEPKKTKKSKTNKKIKEEFD